MPHLMIEVSGRPVFRRVLREGVIVGRSPHCEVQVEDEMISRKHCAIIPTPEGWLLKDLDSRNGTMVNGVDLRQHLLADGDRIEMGDVVVTFDATSRDTGEEAVSQLSAEEELDLQFGGAAGDAGWPGDTIGR